MNKISADWLCADEFQERQEVRSFCDLSKSADMFYFNGSKYVYGLVNNLLTRDLNDVRRNAIRCSKFTSVALCFEQSNDLFYYVRLNLDDIDDKNILYYKILEMEISQSKNSNDALYFRDFRVKNLYTNELVYISFKSTNSDFAIKDIKNKRLARFVVDNFNLIS